MTTKAELQKQFDEWVDQGKQLKDQIDALPDDKPMGRWKPEIGEEYWSISMKGMITPFDHEESDGLAENEYLLGNVYRTEEEAQAALDQQLATVRVLDRIAELNAEQGWVCDFEEYKQVRYTFYYDYERGDISSFDEGSEPSHIIQRYGSKETIETVIKEMESDCLLMLGVSGVAE